MAKVEDIVAAMRRNQRGIRFEDLCKVCNYYFGAPRNESSSHYIYKMPWAGDPRVNIQNDKGMAKVYQVKQVLKAIDRLVEEKQNVN